MSLIAEASKYGKRGRAAINAQHKHLIEGEYVSTKEIAERRGITERVARLRLAKAKAESGPVTWGSFA